MKWSAPDKDLSITTCAPSNGFWFNNCLGADPLGSSILWNSLGVGINSIEFLMRPNPCKSGASLFCSNCGS